VEVVHPSVKRNVMRISRNVAHTLTGLFGALQRASLALTLVALTLYHSSMGVLLSSVHARALCGPEASVPVGEHIIGAVAARDAVVIVAARQLGRAGVDASRATLLPDLAVRALLVAS